jgi:hypothetical protein
METKFPTEDGKLPRFRKFLQQRMTKIVTAALEDYGDRHADCVTNGAKYDQADEKVSCNCDGVTAGWDDDVFDQKDEAFDIKEKELAEECKAVAEPIQFFARQASRWSKMWNFYCNQNFERRRHKRLNKRIRFLRKSAYNGFPECKAAGLENDAEPLKGWKWIWNQKEEQ